MHGLARLGQLGCFWRFRLISDSHQIAAAGRGLPACEVASHCLESIYSKLGAAAAAEALANPARKPGPRQSMFVISFGTSHGDMRLAVGGANQLPDHNLVVRASARYTGEAVWPAVLE